MKFYLISVLTFLIVLLSLVSCESPFLDYSIVVNGEYKNSYLIETKNEKITFEFNGKYRWILSNTIYTLITVDIVNNSNSILEINTAKMNISSEYFNYDYNRKYKMNILPHENDELLLEFTANFDDNFAQTHIPLPKDEKLSLMLEGFTLNNKILTLEKIHFVPADSL